MLFITIQPAHLISRSLRGVIMESNTLSDISVHMNREVIERAFKLATKSEEVVRSVVVERASPPGEGLLSAVYRVRVSGDRTTKCFVVKALVSDMLLRKSLSCESYFQREIDFFTKYLPVLGGHQKILGAKERIQHYLPECYATYCNGKDDYILMEDMVESGYRSLTDDLTLEQRNNTLRCLAHLHAVSIALRVKRPRVFEDIVGELSELYYKEESREWYANYLERAIEVDREVIMEYEDPDSIYCKKFLELTSKDVYAQLISLSTSRSDNKAILHGDSWPPNFLCSKERAVAIDFQVLRCASPAIELSYFILICGHLCQGKKDFDEAVAVYYDGLKYFLEDMNISAEKFFSKEQLDIELKKFGAFGLLACLTSIPLRGCADRCDCLDSFAARYEGQQVIPLEELWRLRSFDNDETKLRLVNVLRVAVDASLI